jgi:DUF2934 family protein
MKRTAHLLGTGTTPTHDHIALLAYCLWEKGGGKPGRDLDYWLAAEKQLNGISHSSPQQRPVADPAQTQLVEAPTTKTSQPRPRGNGHQIQTATARF